MWFKYSPFIYVRVYRSESTAEMYVSLKAFDYFMLLSMLVLMFCTRWGRLLSIKKGGIGCCLFFSDRVAELLELVPDLVCRPVFEEPVQRARAFDFTA